MLRAHSHPAVSAGLATTLVALPQVAQATSYFGSTAELLKLTIPPFLIGCFTGAAAGGLVSMIIARRQREQLLDELEAVYAPASHFAQEPVAAQPEAPARVESVAAAEDKPAYRGKHFKPVAMDEVLAGNVPDAPVARAEEPAVAPREEVVAAPAVVAQESVPQPRSEEAPAQRASARRGGHLRKQDWENTGSIRVQSPEDSAVLHIPQVETEPPDYADVAEQYVRRLTFRERMAIRARGVANVLAERLSGNKMDGVPVIVRADGTTGDVGTAWWEAAVGDRIRRDGIEREFLEDTAEHDVHEQVRRSQDTTSSLGVEEPDFLASAQPGFREVSPITARVAQVEEGVYPEIREFEDMADEDEAWARALAAMDERVKEQIRLDFQDIVGDADTIDEPEGLEPATSFIPFRTPAGHPEVVDTETYVDYLLNEEFSQNPSQAARHSSRRYLKVIEGGSTSSFRIPVHRERPMSESRDEQYRGNHFARAKEA